MTENTAWMWSTADGDVHGANLDHAEQMIYWFDSGVGCACGDSSIVQSFAQFEQAGPALQPPPDVQAEMRASIHGVSNR
jgi:hypothetical protein